MKRILLTVCLSVTVIFCVQSGSIPIRGRLLKPGMMRVGASPASILQANDQPATVPVAAQQNPASVELTFLSDLGNLTIQVVNAQGYTAYQQTVNAAAESRLEIGTQDWTAGTYTILILDGQDGRLEGQFVK